MDELGQRLWVVYVAERSILGGWSRSERSRRKRMLCFRTLDGIHRAVEERLAWASADEQFRATQMATPGGFPGVTADWVPSKDFELVFATARCLLREQICTTPSAQTVVLR